jgi:dephospho-CoA kinase
MLRIAVTGNIASGKSRVCNILKKLDFPIVSADEVAHVVIDSPAVHDRFSDYDVFDDNNTIDRSKMGELVFANPELMKVLEEIMHPMIADEMEKFFQNHSDENIIFAEVPLLFEAGLENQYDITILVYADDVVRLDRLMRRNSLSEEQALARMRAQQSQDDKIPKSSFIIWNNNDADISDQVSKILAYLPTTLMKGSG